MCFGLKSAPEVFQRKMQLELQGLEAVKCIMDDILIHAKTQTELDKRLDLVLTRLMKANVTLNPKKCEFSKQKLKFVGYQISSKGIEVDKDKTEATEKMERPQNVSDVRRFLGIVNHLQKFVKNLAVKTLRDLLSTKNQWYWGPPQEKAFCKLKGDLSKTPVLAHYQPEREATVSADSSSFGLRACILQTQDDGTKKPIAYASRAVTATEQRYAMVDKEALAVTWALERFSSSTVLAVPRRKKPNPKEKIASQPETESLAPDQPEMEDMLKPNSPSAPMENMEPSPDPCSKDNPFWAAYGTSQETVLLKFVNSELFLSTI